jgi:hypothetical protein
VVSTESSKTKLQWSVPSTVTVPAGTWCGYEWTIPESVQENVIRWYTAGYYNIPSTTELRLINNLDQILWTFTGEQGWVNNYSNVFAPSDTIRLILYQKQAARIWAGNKVYTKLMHMYTQNIPKYFGYYFTIQGNNDYFDDVKNFTNLNHYLVSDANISDLNNECISNGTQMLIHVNWQFLPEYFTGDTLTTTIHWNQLKAKCTNGSGDFYSGIAAFYCDEPYWRGMTPGQVQTMIDTIKDSWSPCPRVMLNYARPTIDSGQGIPTNCDWVSFDYYGKVYGDHPSVESYKNIMKSRKTSSQKLFLLPPATQSYGINYTDDELRWMSWDYYDLANDDPEIIGLLGFLVPDVLYLDLTKTAHINIGNTIKY